MELKPGMKVKLLPLSKVNKLEEPTVAFDMEKYFDNSVTIEEIITIGRTRNEEIWFKIEEDGGKYKYNPNWIKTYINLPDELFRI